MAVDIRRIPFTEMTERVQKELIRDNSAAEAKYKGRINDVYLYDIPSQIDWRHLRKTANVVSVADYTTGYISVTSGTTITGSGTSWTSANSDGLLLKVSGYDELYRCTYVGATSLTIDRDWIGTDISTNTSYTLFQDRYTLASDYSRMILDPNKAIYYWDSGHKIYLTYRGPDEFEEAQVWSPDTPAYYTIKWISGDPYIFVDPPDGSSRTIYYVYIPTLARMSEYTTGTITTLANGDTAVTGSGTDFDGFVTDTTAYDYYFRIDGDGVGSKSKWYKIASAGSNTSLTLSDAYAGSSIAAGDSTYTISVVSLLPAGLDTPIMYGAAIISSVDQSNETQVKNWAAISSSILSQYKAIEGKKNYGQKRIHTIYEKSGVRR